MLESLENVLEQTISRRKLFKLTGAGTASLLIASSAHADPSFSERFYQLLDERRVQHGLASIPRSTTLEMTADHIAWQMSIEGKFSHNYEKDDFIISSLSSHYEENPYSRRAEFLGKVYPAVEKAPEFMMNMFEQSCGHRRLILWQDAEWVGIGIAIANDGTLYMVGVLTGNVSPSGDCP